ncbi:MAG TPA: recombinase family protein [Aggregatilineales bacterium]|nr:recombinase family protein [Aggregatilineales bacterium]
MIRCIIWCAVSSRAQTEPDKISLPQQEADACALAEGNGWQIVDVLRVPGHSRRYVDFHQLASDAARQGVDAFHRLQRHWEAQDFDVMVVRDGDRFARTQALHAYVVERTINVKARIYSLQDGWVDDNNYRMFIAMSGYKAAGDIDRLVKARDKSMTARAARGLPTSSRIPMSHRMVRDQSTGRAVRLQVNEAQRRLWTDLAELILEGVAWYSIEDELYTRYGHVREDGERYYSGYMYRLLMKPIFWGHIARNHYSSNAPNGYKGGAWIYDENEPMPAGATIFRNTHEAVWQGELAERVKAEIRRRSEAAHGNMDPRHTHRFSGLGVCAECGSYWATHVKKSKKYRGVLCPAAKAFSQTRPKCSNRRILNEKRLIALVNGYLKQMLERNSTDVFREPDSQQTRQQSRIETLGREIDALELEARGLIREQARAGTELQALYQEELAQINVRLKNMKVTRDNLQVKQAVVQQTTALQDATLDEIAAMSLEAFWQQESRYINQVLHRLMGKKRFLLLDGEIIGVAEVTRRQRSHA